MIWILAAVVCLLIALGISAVVLAPSADEAQEFLARRTRRHP